MRPLAISAETKTMKTKKMFPALSGQVGPDRQELQVQELMIAALVVMVDMQVIPKEEACGAPTEIC
jgi:hypothetical protein